MTSLFSNTFQIFTFKCGGGGGGGGVTKIPQMNGREMAGERKGKVEGAYEIPQFNYSSVQLKVIHCESDWFWEISNLQFNITVYTKQAVIRLLFILDSSCFIFKPSNQNDTKIKTVHKLFKENTCFSFWYPKGMAARN